MTEEEIKAIETHIEIHAKAEPRAIKITEILRKTVRELKENNRLTQQIVELQKDKRQLIDELTKKADTNHSLVEQMAEQNEQIEQATAIIKRAVEWAESYYPKEFFCDIKIDAEKFLKESNNG